MKNRIRRLSKSLVCIILIFLLALPVMAITDVDLSQLQLFVNNDKARIYRYVYEATLYEMDIYEDTSLSKDISFGDILSTYYLQDSLENLHNITLSYIPIFCGGQLEAVAVVVEKDGQVISVEMSYDLVDEISEYKDKEICMVFSDTDTYIYSENQLTLLESYEHIFTSAELDEPNDAIVSEPAQTLTEIPFSQISTNCLTDIYSLEQLSEMFYPMLESSFSEDGMYLRSTSYPPNKELDVPIVPQNGVGICWAAVVASIGNYLTNDDLSAEDVSYEIYGELTGGNTYIALSALQSIYSLDGVDVYVAPGLSIIQREIYEHGQPMYIRVYGSSSRTVLNHALFIGGYKEFSSGTFMGKLYVGDPNFPDDYRTIYFTEDGEYTYTLNGITEFVDQYVMVY